MATNKLSLRHDLWIWAEFIFYPYKKIALSIFQEIF